MRTTDDFVFFWGGPLSNWHQGRPFRGEQALEITYQVLERIGVSAPSPSCIASRLMAEHVFACGEQWMMAAKAWLFETDRVGWLSAEAGDRDIRALLDDLLLDELPKDSPSETVLLWELPLARILRNGSPKEQKALGRRIRWFDESVWNRASTGIVAAGTVARADADPQVKRILLGSGSRRFVEGSPNDRVWGVGLRWDDPLIDDPVNWRGQNRLGDAHVLSRQALRLAETL